MTKFIEQIITNPLTGEEKIIEVGDVFLTLSEEDKQKTISFHHLLYYLFIRDT